MKPYKTILLDQDGCIASFVRAVIVQCNLIKGTDVSLDDIIEGNRWDLETYWNLTSKEWWEVIDIDSHFWLNIPKLEWADGLYQALTRYADEVVIASNPSNSKNCHRHKLEWLESKMGIPQNDVMLGKRKYLMANKDTLLIDDSQVNVDEFIKAGGNAVCIPSDWNTKDLNFDIVWREISKHL